MIDDREYSVGFCWLLPYVSKLHFSKKPKPLILRLCEKNWRYRWYLRDPRSAQNNFVRLISVGVYTISQRLCAYQISASMVCGTVCVFAISFDVFSMKPKGLSHELLWPRNFSISQCASWRIRFFYFKWFKNSLRQRRTRDFLEGTGG